MKSATLGKNTSGAELTNISRHGFWLLLADEEPLYCVQGVPLVQECLCG
jgi:hypothetical protein